MLGEGCVLLPMGLGEYLLYNTTTFNNSRSKQSPESYKLAAITPRIFAMVKFACTRVLNEKNPIDGDGI